MDSQNIISKEEMDQKTDPKSTSNRTEKLREIRSELKRKSIELPSSARPTSKVIPAAAATVTADASANATASATANASADKGERKKRKMAKGHRRGKNKKDRKNTQKNAAPFNTTQFIMNDHGDTIQYLDKKLGVKKGDQSESNPSAGDVQLKRKPRAKESSFSLDSDEDFYYSSPEGEDDFLSKEFLKDYNNIKSDRLVSLSKNELIGEYLQMEAKVDMLEKRVERSRRKYHIKNGNREGAATQVEDKELKISEIPLKPEAVQNIRYFKQEIRMLSQENRKLKKENLLLKQEMELESGKPNNPTVIGAVEMLEIGDSGSSCSSSSSSSCSSSCSTCSSSENEDENSMGVVNGEQSNASEGIEQDNPEMPQNMNMDENAQDTSGYDRMNGGNSKKTADEVNVTSTTSK